MSKTKVMYFIWEKDNEPRIKLTLPAEEEVFTNNQLTVQWKNLYFLDSKTKFGANRFGFIRVSKRKWDSLMKSNPTKYSYKVITEGMVD